MNVCFTITVAEGRTQVHTEATGTVNPAAAIEAAMGALQAELEGLRSCPAHVAQQLTPAAGWLPRIGERVRLRSHPDVGGEIVGISATSRRPRIRFDDAAYGVGYYSRKELMLEAERMAAQ